MSDDNQDGCVYVYGEKCRKVGDHEWLSIFVSEDKILMIINNNDNALYGLMDNSRESINNLFETMGYRKNAKGILNLF